MAVFTQTWITPGVGSAWVEVIKFFSQWQRAAAGSLTFTLTTAAGYRAILMNAVIDADTYTYTWICTDIESAATCSLRQLAQSPGWRAIPNYEAALTGAASGSVTNWRNKVVALRRSIWSTWGGAALGTQQQETILCEAAQYNVFLDYWRVSKKYEAMVDNLAFFGWLDNAARGFLGGKGPIDGLDTYPAPVPIDLNGVTLALQDINNSRLDVSLNNGAVVVSAVGGTNVT